MKKTESKPNKVTTFASEVGSEMKKTTWPSRQELVESTVIVIVSVLAMGFIIAFYDKVLVEILKIII